MIWWLLGLVYFVGVSFLVRRQILTKTDSFNAEVTRLEALNEETCTSRHPCTESLMCLYHCHQRDKARMWYRIDTIVVPILWPFVVPVWLWWKVLFPRGVRTKQMIADAQAKAIKDQEAELRRLADEIERMSKVAGLPVPKGLNYRG